MADTVTVTCPSWCDNTRSGNPCRGEHYGIMQFVAVTGSYANDMELEHGATFPVVGVVPCFSEHPNDQDDSPLVTLSVTGASRDLNLRVSEARKLVELLNETLALITK